MKACLLVIVLSGWIGLWFTADQQGRRLFERGDYRRAAEVFVDPLWQATAWYRAGEFRKAAEAFGRLDGAEARFNEGNARLMQGQYEAAAACYDRALEERPDWAEAAENKALALARAEAVKQEGGVATGGQLEADEVVFDPNAGSGDGERIETAGGSPMSDQEIQALWLRRVQTRPADFLRAKFAHQLKRRETEEGR